VRFRRRKAPPATASRLSTFEDVEPGEGGEPATDDGSGGISTTDTAPSIDTDSYDSTSGGTGTTTGTGSLNLEVALLSINAVDEIAREVARRVAPLVRTEGLKGIVLSSPELLATLRLRASLNAELDLLEAIIARGSGAPKEEANFAVPAIAPVAAESARRVVANASAALTSFAVTTHYSGRKGTVAQKPLDAALAKHLSEQGIKVQLPVYALPKAAQAGFIARLLNLRSRCSQGSAEGEGQGGVDVGGIIDGLVTAIFGGPPDQRSDGDARLAQRLMLADSIAAATDEGFGALFAEISASGGSYRTRRWILNFLTGKDGLTYNGGAAVTYFLFRADQTDALASDTLYFATPHGRFRPPASHFRSDNLLDEPHGRRR